MVEDLGYQILQVSLHVFVLAAGLAVCLCVGLSVNIFQGCVFNASMQVIIGSNGSISIDPEGTTFGPLESCWYDIAFGILAVVYAVTWTWFYITHKGWMWSGVHKGSGKKTRFFLPSLLFSSLLCVGGIIAACATSSGISSWCQQLHKPLGDPGQSPTCDHLSKGPWDEPERGREAYWYIKYAGLFSWLLTAAFAAQVLTLSMWYLCRRTTLSRYTTLKESQPQLQDPVSSGSGYDNVCYGTGKKM